MAKSDNEFTYYRTDIKTDLLFQVDNNNKKKKDRCWSRNLDGIQQTNRMEENIPSCSSNTKNNLVVADRLESIGEVGLGDLLWTIGSGDPSGLRWERR